MATVDAAEAVEVDRRTRMSARFDSLDSEGGPGPDRYNFSPIDHPPGGSRETVQMSIEHGLLGEQSQATFSLTDEDHTLANSLRYILNQDPRVTFCGYSIPHPADARVNIRVQTTGDPAREVLKDSCQDLMLACHHVRNAIDQAFMEFKSKQGVESMDIK